jgi:hypothetical protein
MISSFHLLPIRETVVATGHSGNSSFVSIGITPCVESYFDVASYYNAVFFTSQLPPGRVGTQVTFL